MDFRQGSRTRVDGRYFVRVRLRYGYLQHTETISTRIQRWFDEK